MPTELLLVLSGLGAGTFGAMLGLGGGILIVPILTLGFGVPLTAAVGTSLVCVIATSTGAAAVNVRAGRADVRLGITLGAATVVGAASGGILAGFLPERILAGLFAALLVYTALTMLRSLRGTAAGDSDGHAVDPTAPDGPGAPAYRTHRLPAAWAGSLVAGHASGLLGVGGGIVSVPLIRVLMQAPMRVAVATSNFMIGITAAAGAAAYLFRGEIDPRQAAPVVIGVTLGAALGAGIAARLRPAWLTGLFVLVVGYVAVRMALRALGAE
ncbi:MAG TPA: sulfite exporter TauE/SafE family protein [Candidatus Angelobacter sp.]|nr:sulfite exporter TauE/SafE family protein [Candidatus Angelobacter sp.]